MRHLWLTPHKAGEAREYKEEHYHMDFPSNEGALMTIGFLTFAVFLIKLVLVFILITYRQQIKHFFLETDKCFEIKIQ